VLLKLCNISVFILVAIFRVKMGRKGEMGRYKSLKVGIRVGGGDDSKKKLTA
jgi:hypothetical protein